MLIPDEFLAVVGAEFDNHDVWIPLLGVAPLRLSHKRQVAAVEHSAGAVAAVHHGVAAAQPLLQLCGIAVHVAHVDAVAVGDAIADTRHTQCSSKFIIR